MSLTRGSWVRQLARPQELTGILRCDGVTCKSAMPARLVKPDLLTWLPAVALSVMYLRPQFCPSQIIGMRGEQMIRMRE